MRNALAVVVTALLLTVSHADAWQVNSDGLSRQRPAMEFNAVPRTYFHLTRSHSNSRPRIGHHSGRNGPSKKGWGGKGGYHH
jgi:hypothetical protein